MKKTSLLGTNLLASMLMIIFASFIQAKEVPVKITDIRSARGKIIVNVFKDKAEYEGDKPFKTFVFDKEGLADGALTVRLPLEDGVYGFTMIDDENGNGKIDKNLIRIPKEGFGFSNFFLEKMKKPSFDDFKVDLKTHTPITIKVKYM